MMHNLEILFVDYLQLISAGKRGRNQNTHEDVSFIARELKNIAKEFHIPVIAISSISNEAMKEPDKRPKANHLKESGDIYYAADVVCTLYRPEIVLIKEFTDYNGQLHKTENLLVIDTWKQRDGRTGETLSKIDGAKMKITRWGEREVQEEIVKNYYETPQPEEPLPF